MNFSINRVTLKGNLGKDPEIKILNDGSSMATFSVATSETWKDVKGDKQERTQWHNVVVWPKLAVEIAKTLRKGSTVMLEGQLQTRSYEQDGQKRWTTEVVLNGFNCSIDKIERLQSDRAPAPESRNDYGSQGSGNPSSGADIGDEIPFSAEFR
jgi:single-strand DNA-binding protein